MGAYENLVRDTASAVLKPDEPLSIDRLARVVALRASAVFRDDRIRPLDMLLVEAILRGDPRFVEVAPGMWVRRHDGPEAGVPSRPRRPPLAGSAAAAVVPPEPHVHVDAVGSTAGRATTAAT
ncbi:MAG TPA: hypothetical protein VE953_14630 [Terriglobales bacterium]|nr:hypothetical protein [Terriglobales bacterium]